MLAEEKDKQDFLLVASHLTLKDLDGTQYEKNPGIHIALVIPVMRKDGSVINNILCGKRFCGKISMNFGGTFCPDLDIRHNTNTEGSLLHTAYREAREELQESDLIEILDIKSALMDAFNQHYFIGGKGIHAFGIVPTCPIAEEKLDEQLNLINRRVATAHQIREEILKLEKLAVSGKVTAHTLLATLDVCNVLLEKDVASDLATFMRNLTVGNVSDSLQCYVQKSVLYHRDKQAGREPLSSIRDFVEAYTEYSEITAIDARFVLAAVEKSDAITQRIHSLEIKGREQLLEHEQHEIITLKDQLKSIPLAVTNPNKVEVGFSPSLRDMAKIKKILENIITEKSNKKKLQPHIANLFTHTELPLKDFQDNNNNRDSNNESKKTSLTKT